MTTMLLDCSTALRPARRASQPRRAASACATCWALIASCCASGVARAAVQIDLVSGYVEALGPAAAITLLGVDDAGNRYQFACYAYGRSPWTTYMPVEAGQAVLPTFYTTSSDFGGYSLTVNGMDVSVQDDSTALGTESRILVDGPALTAPTDAVSAAVLTAAVQFELLFNLFAPGEGFATGAMPLFVFAGTGLGSFELALIPYAPSTGFDGFYLASAVYQLLVPEPGSLAVWALIGSLAGGMLQRRRCNRCSR